MIIEAAETTEVVEKTEAAVMTETAIEETTVIEMTVAEGQTTDTAVRAAAAARLHRPERDQRHLADAAV